MTFIFQEGTEVTIPDVLANRDYRVALQNKLTEENPNAAIVGAKLNIPGPIKNNNNISCFFDEQMKLFENLLSNSFEFKLFEANIDNVTGPESFYIVQGEQKAVKKICVEFEESKDYRRLFDLDVHFYNKKDLSRTVLGLPVRQCLICGRPAKECGRARTHSVKELQNKVSELIFEALDK